MSPDHASIPNVVRVARAAAAADARRRFITASGYALAGAMGTAAAGVGIASLLTDAPWWWVVPVGAGAASIAIAGGVAWVRRWSLDHAAGEIDRANGTEGALRTAIEIRDRDGEPSLVALARQRGERVAVAVDTWRGIAPPDHRGWWWSVPAIGACVAFGLLLEPIDHTPKRPDPSPMIARALDQTEPGLEEARAVEPESLPDPEKWAETMAEIEALEEELRRGDAAEDAPTRAAAAMEQAADELDRQAELAAREEQAIRDRAEAYRTDEMSDPSPLAQRLADALARNDMDAAEQAAREIDRASESLSEEELRALADTLEDMASRLDDPAAMPREPTGQVRDPSQTPPSPTDPAGQPDQPESTRPEQTPEVTPPPTQEPQSLDRQNPESLPEALRRQAESLREPPRDPSQQDANQDQTQPPNEQSGDQPQSGQPSEQPEPRPGEQTGERPSADPNQQQPQSQPSQNPNQQGQPQSSQQGEPQQEQPAQGQEQQGSQQQPQEQQGQQQQGQQEQGQPQQGNEQGDQQQPGEQPTQQPTQQPGRQGQPQPGEQPGGQPQPRPSGQPGDQPEQQPGQQPGQQPQQVPTPDPSGQPQGTPQPDPNAPPGSIERAIERLREQQDARQRNRQVAESLRERARGLMDDPSLPPGDGGAGREDAPLAQDNPLTDDPSRYEPVDASGQAPQDPESGRVVGEWFDPNREDLPPSERAAAAGEMRRAVRKARDAMDNQQVPRRYRDLVRRVFDRVERRADAVAPGPAPQGQDAQP